MRKAAVRLLFSNEAHLRCMKNEVWLRHMKFDGIMSKPACALLHTSVSEYFMAAKLPFYVRGANASLLQYKCFAVIEQVLMRIFQLYYNRSQRTIFFVPLSSFGKLV